MPNLGDLADNFARIGPHSLWEAMALLGHIQDEQERVTRQGDLGRLNRLLSEQAVAWSYVKAFALGMIERNEAPPDLVDRLRTVLQVHPHREQEVEQAQRRLAERSAATQEAAAASVYLRKAA